MQAESPRLKEQASGHQYNHPQAILEQSIERLGVAQSGAKTLD
jgi:hypothetical protein